eukprot:GHUV01033885.1.p1 GENE.GHUV01033885.1~~GHUV01033885.1.p1  ORF type:complete len:280 (+),score=64.00 GHUV01033885.1:286-1125(+)
MAKSHLGAAAVQRLIGAFVTVKPAEVSPVLCSFFTLFSILGSYFLLLPLREDAGISLGTSTLPLLFVSSLVVTVLFSPAASAFLARSTIRDRELALKRLYSFMAATLLVFYLLYNFSAVQHILSGISASTQHPQQSQQQHLQGQQQARHTLSWSQQYQQQRQSAAKQAAEGQNSADVKLSGRRLHHELHDPASNGVSIDLTVVTQHHDESHSYPRTPGGSDKTSVANTRPVASSRDGDPMLTHPQRVLRAAFYIWVNVINLVGEPLSHIVQLLRRLLGW